MTRSFRTGMRITSPGPRSERGVGLAPWAVLPLDDDLLALHRDLDRPVLGDHLLEDPDLARLHELRVGMEDPPRGAGSARAARRSGGPVRPGPPRRAPHRSAPGSHLMRPRCARPRPRDGEGWSRPLRIKPFASMVTLMRFVTASPMEVSSLLDPDLVLSRTGLAKFTDGGFRLAGVLKDADQVERYSAVSSIGYILMLVFHPMPWAVSPPRRLTWEMCSAKLMPSS